MSDVIRASEVRDRQRRLAKPKAEAPPGGTGRRGRPTRLLLYRAVTDEDPVTHTIEIKRAKADGTVVGSSITVKVPQ